LFLLELFVSMPNPKTGVVVTEVLLTGAVP